MSELFNINSNKNKIVLSSTIKQDDITKRITNAFDYEFDGTITTEFTIPNFPKEFSIGLIVGSSGSGKSTLLKTFGNIEEISWNNDICIASHFIDFEDASHKFGAVGLNSIPTWLKPYKVLSTGEKFRADMARSMHDNAIIDEFTSVVNRECAISCSLSISKYIRKFNLKNIVFASCHDDIIEYLQPDWIYYTDRQELVVGRSPTQRPKIVLEVNQCSKQIWSIFKQYHYLSGELNSAADCYLLSYNNRPVAFHAVLPMPGRFGKDDTRFCYSSHRLVVLPDFQGMGIGTAFVEYVARLYVSKGYRFFLKTANPRLGEHCNNSVEWRNTTSNQKKPRDLSSISLDKLYIAKKGRGNTVKSAVSLLTRYCYSHEYLGDEKLVEQSKLIAKSKIKEKEKNKLF